MYGSFARASVFTVVFAVGTTALWVVAELVTEGWVRDWLVRPPVDIQLWKRSLMFLAISWPKAWPIFVAFVWTMTFLSIELARRIKARRT